MSADVLLATSPVSWGPAGSDRALGAGPLEWRKPSGLMLTRDGWTDVGGGSEDDLSALRSEVDALVRLYFVADQQTFYLLQEKYQGAAGLVDVSTTKALYNNYIGTVADIAKYAGASAEPFKVDKSFYTPENLFRNVFLGHGAEGGWTGFWPDGTVDLMDVSFLHDTANAVMELARHLVEIEVAAFSGTYLDWDVLMGTGEYPKVAELLGGGSEAEGPTDFIDAIIDYGDDGKAKAFLKRDIGKFVVMTSAINAQIDALATDQLRTLAFYYHRFSEVMWMAWTDIEANPDNARSILASAFADVSGELSECGIGIEFENIKVGMNGVMEATFIVNRMRITTALIVPPDV